MLIRDRSPVPLSGNRTWSWSGLRWWERRPWGRWRWRSRSCSSSPLRLGRKDALRTRCCDPTRYPRRTWPGPSPSCRTFAGGRICAERERDAKRSGRKQDGTFYLSASSPSNVITAESARVMAGAEKNSPTMTSNSSRKKVFWMSWTRDDYLFD